MIHDPKEQADVVALTWQKIMTPNKPRNTEEVLANVDKVKKWISCNQQQINPHPTLPTSYRPIALITLLSKILEKIIAHRLRNYLEGTGQMNLQQHGFRSGKSTEDIIIKSLFYIDTYTNLNKN